MTYEIHPITKRDADDIATWQYPTPYALYSLTAEVIPLLLDPLKRYFAVRDVADDLVGYCCFGQEARVMGGEYPESESSVLDIGVGMRPERVGEGNGRGFVGAILLYAAQRYKPARFRVTIAQFNKRSLRTFESLRFEESYRFKRPGDHLVFIQLERQAHLNEHL